MPIMMLEIMLQTAQFVDVDYFFRSLLCIQKQILLKVAANAVICVRKHALALFVYNKVENDKTGGDQHGKRT